MNLAFYSKKMDLSSLIKWAKGNFSMKSLFLLFVDRKYFYKSTGGCIGAEEGQSKIWRV